MAVLNPPSCLFFHLPVCATSGLSMFLHIVFFRKHKHIALVFNLGFAAKLFLVLLYRITSLFDILSFTNSINLFVNNVQQSVTDPSERHIQPNDLISFSSCIKSAVL